MISISNGCHSCDGCSAKLYSHTILIIIYYYTVYAQYDRWVMQTFRVEMWHSHTYQVYCFVQSRWVRFTWKHYWMLLATSCKLWPGWQLRICLSYRYLPPWTACKNFIIILFLLQQELLRHPLLCSLPLFTFLADRDPTKHLPVELHFQFPCCCCYDYPACQ